MEKYTIVLAHYNQMEYIEEAIKSIMKQDYKNIELIVADDCSPQFNYKKIEKMIKKHNVNNYEYKILSMEKNSGTVKNLNNALNNATGDFIQFFASDDALYNSKVVSRFVEEFKDQTKNIITAQCVMCDHKLKKVDTYVDVKMAESLNKKGVSALFEMMSEYCIYSAGATVYRTKILKDSNLFDEKYKFIEDWASWIKLTRDGEMIYYVDFIAFKHRDGGISHSEYTRSTLPSHVRGYYKDLLEVYKTDILPYIDKYKVSEQYRILRRMEDNINYFGRFAPELYDYQQYFRNKKDSNTKLKYYWKMRKIADVFKVNLYYRIKMLIIKDKSVPISFFLSVLSYILLNSFIKIKSSAVALAIYLAFYVFIYIIINAICKYFEYIIERKNIKKCI